MEETSVNEIKPINQFLLEIDFESTKKNALGSSTFWRFGISKRGQ